MLGCVAWLRAWLMLSGWLRTCFVSLVGCVACFRPLLASLLATLLASFLASLSARMLSLLSSMLVRSRFFLPASRPNTFVSPRILPAPPPLCWLVPLFWFPTSPAGIYLFFASVVFVCLACPSVRLFVHVSRLIVCPMWWV